MKKSIIAANWKMYKTIDESVNFFFLGEENFFTPFNLDV